MSLTAPTDTRELRARTAEKLRRCDEEGWTEEMEEMAERIQSEDFRSDDNRSRL